MPERNSLPELLVGLIIAIGALAVAVWGAAQQWSYLRVLVPVSVSWAGYLLAHHGETGRFVDEPGVGDSPDVPDSTVKQVSVVALVVVMALAFPLGIHALVVDSFVRLLVAAAVFVGGYVAGHLLLTGSAF
ncbi:hypothetical protein [Halorubellus salinus]|uniref:hypothetical protein n=1 Tax=Halorubellus salinus TaxID=755309 RepID=UPI001D077F57|nr:hypothetical protein [Halorubellus salinus]